MTDSSDALKKALEYSYRLLNIRLRSEHELEEKLLKKEFDANTIKSTVDYLKELGYINDAVFAKSWISSRLKKPFGQNRIRYELRNKGIEKAVIDRTFNELLNNDYDELDVVSQLAEHRRKKYKNLDEKKIQQRLLAYLSRRGFNPQIIYKAIMKNHEN